MVPKVRLPSILVLPPPLLLPSLPRDSARQSSCSPLSAEFCLPDAPDLPCPSSNSSGRTMVGRLPAPQTFGRDTPRLISRSSIPSHILFAPPLVERGAQHFIDLTPALSHSLVAAAE
eukprot:767799-Hanusia_phi.AAC.1